MNPKPMIVVALASLTLLCSCAVHRQPILEKPEVLHVVLVQLNAPSDVQELIDDTQKALGLSGSTRAVTPAVPFDMDRPEVDDDYDAAFVMEFKDAETYQRYLTSPEHVQLVQKWKPRASSMRVFDMQRAYASNKGMFREYKNHGREVTSPSNAK